MAQITPSGMFEITPGVDLDKRAYGLYVQGEGTVSFVGGDGVPVTDLPVGPYSSVWSEVLSVSDYTGTGSIWGYAGRYTSV